MKPDGFNIEEFIEYLQGSCKTIADACSDFGIEESDLTEEDHNEIDINIFNCDTCNWWYELGEMSADEENCTNCSLHGDEEE